MQSGATEAKLMIMLRSFYINHLSTLLSSSCEKVTADQQTKIHMQA